MPLKGSFGAAAARAFQAMLGAFNSFSDNFNRTTSGELGTSSSGGAWKALKGTWFANGSSAKSNDSASTYPIANIEMSNASVTASISTGSGTTVISTGGTVGSIIVGDGTTGTVGFYEATITGMSSTTGLAVGNWISATSGTGSLYGGTPDYVEVTSIISSSSIKYRTKGGTTPTAGTISSISTRGNDGGSGVALWTTDSGNWWGISYGRSIDTACNCSTCSNSYCNTYTNYSSNYCGGYTNYANSYTGCTSWLASTYTICPSGFSVIANPCTTWGTSMTYTCVGNAAYTSFCNSYTAQYSCTTYGTYGCATWKGTAFAYNTTKYNYKPIAWACNTFRYTSSQCVASVYAGSTCNSSTYGGGQCNSWLSYTGYVCNTWGNTYSCSGGYNAYSTYTCPTTATYSTWSPACSGGTYTAYAPACTSTTYGYVACNCQTCYPPYIAVVQSASNAVSEITRWSLSSMAGAFKVITNSLTKVITIRPYKDKEMTTQIGSDLTYTATTATIANKFGIVLTPSDQIQGSNIDDFNININ